MLLDDYVYLQQKYKAFVAGGNLTTTDTDGESTKPKKRTLKPNFHVLNENANPLPEL